MTHSPKRVAFYTRPTVFTTGAHLDLMCITNDNGDESWHWFVSEFVNDTYRDGELFNPPESGSSEEAILTIEDDDDDDETIP